GADSLTDWAEFMAPALAGRAARLYSRTKMGDPHRPLFNTKLSNMRGTPPPRVRFYMLPSTTAPPPPFPLYSNGARVVAHYPMGPIFDGGGLNITVMSYLDQLDFGLVACSDLIDDVWSLADGLGASLDELLKSV